MLALVSVAAVAAQVLSTLDMHNRVGVDERIVLISLGFSIGLLVTIAITLWPVSGIRIRRLTSKRRRRRSTKIL